MLKAVLISPSIAFRLRFCLLLAVCILTGPLNAAGVGGPAASVPDTSSVSRIASAFLVSDASPSFSAPPLQLPVDPAARTPAMQSLPADSCSSVPGSTPALSDDDLLICIARLGSNTLAGGIMTYVTRSAVFLPLGAISQLLELGIVVNQADGTASGFLARPSSPLQLDMASSSIKVSGKAYRYISQLVVALEDDIYVESTLLGEWLSMHLEANRYDASIRIEPFEPLPLQQRMARMQRGANTWGYGSYNDPGYPLLEVPYRFIGGPGIDLSIASSIASTPEKSAHFEKSSYYARLAGDIMFMSGELQLSGATGRGGGSDPKLLPGVDSGSLLLDRVSPYSGLLGPLGASRISLGDIPRSSFPVIGSSSGPGIMVSNYPLTHSLYYDQVTLKGFLSEGWDVELFNNGTLLDYRPSNPEHRYAFVDLPLIYGMNELQLVFHGPQGEQRDETHVYNVGANMIEPGSFNYQLTATDASKTMLLMADTTRSAPQMTWQSTLGVSKWLTTSQYMASGFIEGERQILVGGGMSGYLHRFQLDLQAGVNLATNLWGRQAAVRSRFNQVSFSLGMQEYDPGWQGIEQSTSYLRRLEARIDGLHPFPFLLDSRMSVAFASTDYEDHQSAKTGRVTSYNRSWGVNHTHTLSLERTEGAEMATETIAGSSYASIVMRHLRMRAVFDYTLAPLQSLKNVAVDSEYSLQNNVLLTGSIAYAPETRDVSTSLGISRSTGILALGVFGAYTFPSVWNVGINLSTNFSRQTKSGRWSTNGGTSCRQAGISAGAYLDRNRNQEWDEDEEPLQSVGFFVNQQIQSEHTGPDGLAFIQNLSPNAPADVSISSSTLQDLLWIPAEKGVRVVPRPGYALPVNLPVWITGEVSGVVYRASDGGRKTAAGIAMEAVDGEGNVLSSARSAYDGYYILPSLPTGTCLVRVSPLQAMKLDIISASQEVVIPPEGSYVDNVDIVLETQSPIEAGDGLPPAVK